MAQDHSRVFHLDMIGNLGNQMIEYMVALKFASLVPGCSISNVDLSEWGIVHAPLPSRGAVAAARQQQHIDIPGLAAQMNAGAIQRLEYHGFGQRMENFLDCDFYRRVFVPPFNETLGFGDDVLLCPVRSGDVVDGAAPDYPLTPLKFYADVIAATGLKPVFMGQTGHNAYTDRLRRMFPNAPFLETRGPVRDFETIRQSKNILVGVSTFVWLAAWLSEADNIHLAVSGLFNPMQSPVVDLLPFGDPRYRFHLFPLNYAVDPANLDMAHPAIEPYWRLLPPALLRQQFVAAPRFPRDLADFLAVYDEGYYLADNPDVCSYVKAGFLPDGRKHYAEAGFFERRFPFPLDRGWYALNYPLAAFEVAQGDYADFSHHYLAIGKERGYRAMPDR